jgi:REP element-mobilizing transposase RayT
MHRFDSEERRLIHAFNHARYIALGVPYHVVSKTLRGEFFLTPKCEVRRIVRGVLAQAKTHWPGIELYAYAFLSNHMHMMVSGCARSIPGYVRFVKGEISRRLGELYNSPGPIWHRRYVCTALPTTQSQENCLKYIVSHGVKEELVHRPQQWPGAHCAALLLSSEPGEGDWFNGTRYAKAKYRAKSRRKPLPVREDFYESRTLELSPLPSWKRLSKPERRRKARSLIDTIVSEGRKNRRGRTPLGVQGVLKQPRTTRREPKRPPWFELRRRYIVWANPRSAKTKAYLSAYWEFQEAFSKASKTYRSGQLDAPFPPGAWRPPVLLDSPQL